MYDGYQFAQNIEYEGPFSLEKIKLEVFEGHKDICYASEFVYSEDGIADKILTSSFYDSNLKLL